MAAVVIAAAVLVGCGTSSGAPDDATQFCAYYGSRLMTMTDTTHTPDPARVVESDQEIQEVADRISATEDGAHGIGDLTRRFINPSSPDDASFAAAALHVYCKRHGLT
ncbi:hypothetical protein AB0N17_42500 [Streptomyces sp. NPDC051133]|uniref:hypothetical protein n=1 Tax=Streptomyces sp. NPDC051133 TaxID=3155521 RepID=UPI00343DF679